MWLTTLTIMSLQLPTPVLITCLRDSPCNRQPEGHILFNNKRNAHLDSSLRSAFSVAAALSSSRLARWARAVCAHRARTPVRCACLRSTVALGIETISQ